MNPLDLLILVFVGFNLVLGIFRGAVWQILRIVAIVLGVWAAGRWGDELHGMFPGSIREGSGGRLIAQVVIFLSVYLVMFGVTHLVRGAVKKIDLGSVDRLLGAALGAAKGALIGCILLYLQFVPFVTDIDQVRNWLYGNEREGISHSIANRIFLDHVKDKIEQAVPDDLEGDVDRFVHEADGYVRPR